MAPLAQLLDRPKAGAGLLPAGLAPLAPAACLGSPQGYTRHVAYADPAGRYTALYLVWRAGQFSPVHGHRTWCVYRVLQGELRETLYGWDDTATQAYETGIVARRPGDVVRARPGLQNIHRLGNAGGEVAISLHIYGVDEASVACGVNLLVAAAA
jgi:predicted metal-dependent enzyme (double-stranded beta helix superfamily)